MVGSLCETLTPWPHVINLYMWTEARKNRNISVSDQYSITRSPSLPSIVSHLRLSFGHSSRICARNLPEARSCPTGHHMLHVSLTLVNSTAVTLATPINSQHSSSSPWGKHQDQARIRYDLGVLFPLNYCPGLCKSYWDLELWVRRPSETINILLYGLSFNTAVLGQDCWVYKDLQDFFFFFFTIFEQQLDVEWLVTMRETSSLYLKCVDTKTEWILVI